MILGYGFSVVVGKRKYYPVSSLEIQGGKTFRTVAVADGRRATPNIIPATTYSVPFAVADGRHSTPNIIPATTYSVPFAVADGQDSTPNIIPATTYSVPFAVADSRDSTRAHVMLDVESWPSATANGTECFCHTSWRADECRKRLQTKYPMYLDDGTVV